MRSCGSGRSMTWRGSGPRSWSSSTCASRRAATWCSAIARCRAREWFPGLDDLVRRARVPRQGRRRGGDPPSRPRCGRSWRSGRGGGCGQRRRGSRPACGRWASARATGWSPTCRTSPRRWRAFLACASIGAVWSSAAPEFGARSVIDRFAQVEPKVLLAIDGYRYGGKDFDRGAIVERIAAEIPGLAQVVRFGYLDGSGWEDGFLGAGGRRAVVRAAAVRSSAVGALQLGDDRAAQADRPRAGRDPDRADQDDEPAPRRPGGRPGVLVLDDRLDDVELPGRRAVDRRLDRAVRRQPGLSVAGRAVGSGGRVAR